MNTKLTQLFVALTLLAGVLVIPAIPAIPGSPAGVAQAAGTPDVQLNKMMPPEMLYGVPIPVSLALTNPAGPDGFNVLFTDVLPVGVDFVSGSPAPLVTTQSDGTTLLVWSNVADMLTGAAVNIDYVIEVDQAVFASGDTVTNSAQAFVNSNPRTLPKINPSPTNLSGDALAASYSGNDSASASTLLIPFELTKVGGTAEDELLRGVHDQQTVYTLTVDNNAVNATTGFTVVDYLPASLEFLGCAPILDSSSVVVSPAVISEEYPGSGIIPPGAATTNPCAVPSSVTTVNLDPDGAGPMPSGVYTRVEWNSASLAAAVGSADLGASGTFSIDYITAIPLQQNTFPGPTPATANLDNNTGAYTTETEASLFNYAEASGTYFTDGSPTIDSSIDAATIEDFSIHKTVDFAEFTQDSVPIFTLLIESSEYALSTGPITVTDTIPSALDFVSASPPPDDLAGVDNGDGTITFTWTLPPFTAPNSSTTITLNTDVREDFRGTTTPVSSNDSYSNTTTLAADATVITDNSGTTEVLPLGDESSASQSASGPSILKEVSEPPAAGTLTCGDGAGITFNPTTAGDYRPGDRVCYRLTVNFPSQLDTITPVVDDYLPDGFTVEGWEFGANNNVDPNGITGPVAPFDDDVPRMRWNLSNIDRGANKFEVVIQAIISDPSANDPGDIADNLMKFRYLNAAGGVFQKRDAALAVLSEAILDLAKGVIEVNSAPVAGAPADGVTVQEGDTVTYQLAVSNTGNEPATNVSVRDVLPDRFACVDVASITNGGVCVTPVAPLTDYIQWDTDDGIAVADSDTVNLTYDVVIPAGISAGATLTNKAGVRQYSGDTNTGTPFVYVPGNNIDTTLTPTNTYPADDTSNVITALPTITKTRTTSVNEAGNAANNQATIGETVSYTIDTTLAGGVTFYNAVILDTIDTEKDLVESSVVVTRDGVAVAVGPAPTGFQVDTTGNAIKVTFPTPYVIPNGAGEAFKITFDVVITDVASNTRTTGSNNRVDFDFENAAGDKRNINDSIGLQIVEPNITLAKSNNDADGVVTAGQTVTYTLAVENDNTVPNADVASNRVSTAHDTVVVDTVPPELIVQTATISNGGVYVAGVPATNPGTITWNIATIDPGTSAALTYDVVTANPLVASNALKNTAVATTTSMPGVVPGERTSASPNGDANGDGYTDDADSTVTVPVLTLTKAAEPATATVGEPITYTVNVTIPGGVIAYDVTVVDDMPAGVTFESLTSVTCAQGAGACSPDLATADALVVPAGPTYASGGDIAFFFDDLTTAAAADRVVTITYVGFVSDAAAASNGATLTNGATVNWNGSNKITTPPTAVPAPATFDESSLVGSDSVGVVEPSLSINKNVAGQIADTDTRRAKPGDVLTYTVTVANTGTAPAYDVKVSDVPANATWFFADTTATAGTTNTDSDPAGGLEWTIAGPIPALTGTATITYTLTVPASYDSTNEVVAGPEQSNTADVPSYFAVPKATRDLHPGRDYRDYDNVTSDTVTIELDLASIGDDVWFDVNNDGIQQPTEPVLANVNVTVTYLGPDNTLGTLDDEVYPTATGSNGKYLVEHLPGGNYVVDVDEADPDFIAGLVPTYDLDDGVAATDGVSAATLAENAKKVNVDFGYTGAGSISKTVWFDQDLDGIVDTNEAGIKDATVTVTWAGPDGNPATTGDNLVYVTTTDVNGEYSVKNLPSGEFSVVVSNLPPGYNNVSEPGSQNDSANTLTLAGSEANIGQNFGYAGVGTVGNFVWLDRSNDGIQDPGEPGLGGVMVQLTSFGPDGVSGGGDDSVFTTTTAANGAYLFSNLPPGKFEVKVTGALPANVVNTFDPDVNGPGDSTSSVTLTLAAPSNLGQDFGYYAASTLGDRVWLDVNNSGSVDDGTEPGINNVQVTATYFGPDGVLGGNDDEVFVTTTSGNGDYLFKNVPDGNYRVQITGGIAPGLVPNFDSSGAQNDGTSNATLATSNLLQDFSYKGAGSIGDTIWFDSDKDGILDTGETGLEGVKVNLTWYGLDGVPGGGDDIVMTATTNSTGKYSFPNLPDGKFVVAVDTTTLPTGMTATFDSDGGTATPNSSTPVTLAAGAAIDTIDFGYSGAGSIGDTIWFDRNGDGVFGADEYPLANVTVALVWNSPTGPKTYLAQTNALGKYLFPNLPPGGYTVTVQTATLPAGMTPTFDGDQVANGLGNTSALTLGNGAVNVAQDFGYNGSASIGDTIYLDLNGDGVQGPGEAGIAGQTVVLTWQSPSGPVTFTTTTDSNGKYSFGRLPDGAYTVTVTGGIVNLAANTGDPTTAGPSVGDSTNNLTIAGGVSNLAQDFGYQGINSIGDTVFWDQNNNGVDDATDPGLENVKVTLVWFGLDGIAGTLDDVTLPVATTNAAGGYSFTGLPDGSFSVAVTGGLPTGLDTNTFDGDDLTVNPNGKSIVTGLGVGNVNPVNNVDQDFGYTGTGSIGDTVYFDTNGNGVQNPGEPGIPGATVTLTWGGPDGNLATLSDNETYPQIITGTDGGYLYENLPAGPFRIDVINPLAGTTPTQDPNGGADNTSQVTLATGANNLVQDFGYTGTGSIGDTIWFDQNLDGIQNPGEDGLGNVGVTVTWAGPDNNLATTADNIAYSTTTTPAGKYLVNKLPAGNYSVVVDTGDLPADYVNVAEPGVEGDSQNELLLGAGENNLVQDFGYSGSGSIGDTIYLDQNGDGGQDLGEPGLVGVTVKLISFGPDGVLGGTDDSFFQTDTGPGGGYLFDNLPVGNYQVTVTGGITTVVNTDDPDLAGAPDAGDSVSTVTLTTASPSDLDQDFGYFADSVLGDRVWWDRNGNGTQETGEPGFGGVVVQINSPSLSIPLTTTTNANGDYLFINIPNSVPGEEYTVTILSGVPDGFSQTFDADGVGQTDETSMVALIDSNLVQDFGYNGTGSIGDTIWFDTNGSGGGGPDGAEFGLQGVTVKLTWLDPDGDPLTDDDIVLTTVTDANGLYSFGNLPNGDFIVDVDETTLPTGLVETWDRNNELDGQGTTAVTLTAAANTITDVNFGYNGTGSIGDTIWFDRNGDGIFDANEYPLSGIGVTLTWNSSQGVETFTTTTGLDGKYSFPNLAPGDYTVAVTVADLPPGMLPTFDADQATSGLNSTSALTLANGEDNEAQNFGYNGTGQVGDTIYLDLDGNGVQGPGEPGVGNQTVMLGWQSPDGRVTFSVTTDANGKYLFDGLPAGNYDVTVVNGVVNDAVNTGDPTAPGPGDSTNTLTLTPGQVNLGQDFGYQGENTIGDRIWFDTNGDGVDDAGEPGLAGIEVTVVWFGPDNLAGTADDVTLPTQLTAADGSYSFTSMPDGNFSVTVTNGLPAGLDTNTFDGDDLAVAPNGTAVVTGLGVGIAGPDQNLGQDFGYTGAGRIGDTIWLDLDGDGIRDPNEPGIPGVQVTLTGPGVDGILGNGDDVTYPTQTTGPSGTYLFDNLPAGDFRVVVVNPVTGLTLSTDPQGPLDGISLVNLDPGEADLAQDFAYVGDASIGDTVFLDVDRDGVQDTNEPGLAGITVTVTSAGVDGILGTPDDIIVMIDTDANGVYVVDMLPAGPTSVTYDVTDLAAGHVPGSDLDGGSATATTVTLGTGIDKRDVDFAIIGNATINGVVYQDTNGNGVKDAGEPGIGGVTIEVVFSGPDGPVVLTTTTNPDGTWSIASVPPGDYVTRVIESTLPAGLAPSTPVDVSTVLSAGGVGATINGFVPTGSIGDTVFTDTNGNGVQDPGEPGIPGVTIVVTAPNGSVRTVVTGAGGTYIVDDLPPGNYVVRVDPTTLPPGVVITADPDGVRDGTTTVTVGPGQNVTTIDFGGRIPPVGGAIPATGTNIALTLMLGALLLAAGWFLLGATRRRRLS